MAVCGGTWPACQVRGVCVAAVICRARRASPYSFGSCPFLNWVLTRIPRFVFCRGDGECMLSLQRLAPTEYDTERLASARCFPRNQLQPGSPGPLPVEAPHQHALVLKALTQQSLLVPRLQQAPMARFVSSWALWGGYHATRQHTGASAVLLLQQARAAHNAVRPPPALRKLLVANRWVLRHHPLH